MKGKFSRELQGRGSVLGIKFKPALFYPFWQAPVSALTDRTIPLSQAFGEAGERLEKDFHARESQEEMCLLLDNFLKERASGDDAQAQEISGFIALILADPEIRRVDDLARRTGCSKRSLQRLFDKYVGVGPKRIIQRYRLHEVLERLQEQRNAAGRTGYKKEREENYKTNPDINWARLALELGYFDQAHVINDFKKFTGLTPGEYAERISP